MSPLDAKSSTRGWWRKYWFVLPTVAFVGFAIWALFIANQDAPPGVVPIEAKGTVPRQSDSAPPKETGVDAGPDMALPVYSPSGRPKKAERKRTGARPKARVRSKKEVTGRESGLKIPCIFRDDCGGTDPDSPSREGTFGADGLKIPSVFDRK